MLPKSLDEFYDRVLLEIDADLKDQALTALKWLAFSVRPVKASELAEVLAVHTEREDFFDPEDRLMDCSGISQILPAGLISTVVHLEISNEFPSDEVSPDGISSNSVPTGAHHSLVQLAHFSVKEYLTADRIMAGPASSYHLDERESHVAIASACLAYILYSSHLAGDVFDHDFELSDYLYTHSKLRLELPLLEFAAHCWPRHVELLGQHSTDLLDQLIINFFKCGGQAFQLWQFMVCSPYALGYKTCPLLDSIDFGETPGGLVSNSTRLSLCHYTPLAIPLWLGLPRVSRLLLELEKYPFPVSSSGKYAQSPGCLFGNTEYLLAKAAANGDIECLQILVDYGADVNSGKTLATSKFSTALEAAVYGKRYETAQFLIRSGANVNLVSQDIQCHTTTPLHRAIHAQDERMIQILLSEGADMSMVDENEHVIFTAMEQGLDMVVQVLNAGASEASVLFAADWHKRQYFNMKKNWPHELYGTNLIFDFQIATLVDRLVVLRRAIAHVHGEEAGERIVVGTNSNLRPWKC